ncbi:MAG TPA: rod shape-determining protein MreD [Ignavibacteriaceae bacterium]|nr:rod shape-determining protein MreD [Ignavibacteriaceae bacterium]
MKLEYLIPLLVFFPLLLVQIIIVPLISIEGFLPDLLLILLIFYTLRKGQLYGTVLGFVFGLFIDLITGSLLGSTMFSKTLTGFIAGYFYNENKIDIYLKSYTFLLIILLSSIIDNIALTLITSFDYESNLLSLLFERSMIPVFYTVTIGAVVMIFYPQRKYI